MINEIQLYPERVLNTVCKLKHFSMQVVRYINSERSRQKNALTQPSLLK